MKNCKAIQDNILQGLQDEDVKKHISKCLECETFFKMQNILNSCESKKVTCPGHLSFESLRLKKEDSSRSHTIFFKYAPLMVAAMLLIGLSIPKYYNGGNGIYQNQINIAKLNDAINTEMDSLDIMLGETEQSLMINEKIIDEEIYSLSSQIDYLAIEEV